MSIRYIVVADLPLNVENKREITAKEYIDYFLDRKSTWRLFDNKDAAVNYAKSKSTGSLLYPIGTILQINDRIELLSGTIEHVDKNFPEVFLVPSQNAENRLTQQLVPTIMLNKEQLEELKQSILVTADQKNKKDDENESKTAAIVKAVVNDANTFLGVLNLVRYLGISGTIVSGILIASKLANSFAYTTYAPTFIYYLKESPKIIASGVSSGYLQLTNQVSLVKDIVIRKRKTQEEIPQSNKEMKRHTPSFMDDMMPLRNIFFAFRINEPTIQTLSTIENMDIKKLSKP